MPKLENNIKTLEITLPQSQAKVTIKSSLTAGDLEDMTDKDPISKQAVRMIVSWDFTDDEGNEIDITEENVRKLDIRDVYEIVNGNELQDFLQEKGLLNSESETK